MKPMRAHYSLIQYCPNRSRLETVNVGVLLFCPEAKFIDVRITAGNEQPRRVFHMDDVQCERLNKAKYALADRIHTTQALFVQLTDLECFIGTRTNDIVLTAHRAMKVFDPHAELDALFRELVGGKMACFETVGDELVLQEEVRCDVQRIKPKSRKARFPELETLFTRLAGERRAVLDYKTTVPTIDQTFKVPYAFKNGIWNLVKPQVFPASEKRANETAKRLAIDGNLIHKHTANTAEASQLIVFADYADMNDKPMLHNRISNLLGEYDVKFYERGNLEEFIQTVEEHAHS